MTEKKVEVATKESKKESVKESQAELDRKEIEAEAFKKFCAITGHDYDDLIAQQKKKENEEIVECDLGPFEVNINGEIYRGKMRVPYPVFEVLSMTVGNKRNRILEEKFGKKGEIALVDGRFQSKIVGKVVE